MKELLSMLLSGVMAFTGIPASTPAQQMGFDDSHLMAKYALVSDASDSSGNGYDAVIKGSGVTFKDGVLTLPGGDKNSLNYVELPEGMFDKKDDLTVSMWVKNNNTKGNYAAFSFGTRANSRKLPENYWLFNPCNPSGNFKSIFTNSVSSTTPWTTEVGISSFSTTQYMNVWTHYTTVISPNSITGYVNGVKVGSAVLSRKVSDFGTGLVASIGKSQYLDDPLFAGSFKDLRVYNASFDEETVKDLYVDSNADNALKEAQNALTLGDTSKVVADIDLPAQGLHKSAITWKSSKPAVITDAGVVTFSDAEETVTLTATLSLSDKSVTKEFIVVTTSKAQLAQEIANKLTVPYVLTARDKLPVSFGTASIVWESNPASLIGSDGTITAPSVTTNVALKANLTIGAQNLTKEFDVLVMEESASYVLGYTRTGASEVTDSLHLGISEDGKTFRALNNNTGVLYPEADLNEGVAGTTKHLASPYLFRMADGKIGVVSLRTDKTNDGDIQAANSVLFYTTKDLLSYESHGLIALNDQSIPVTNPQCEYDSANKEYRITWESKDGKLYMNATSDFAAISAPVEIAYREKSSVKTDIPYAVSANVIAVTGAEAKRLTDKLEAVSNISVDPIAFDTVTGTSLEQSILPKLKANYSDGSSAYKNVKWNQDDWNKIDFNKAGVYLVNGTVDQEVYPFPMIAKRADPNVLKIGDKYYFIATDENGQNNLMIREADSILGLKSASDHVIFRANASGDMASCIWAPELHVINGELYILFAAGNSNGGWATVQSRMMKCTGNPTDAASWEAPTRVVKQDGSPLYDNGITLDMTYLEQNGEHFVMWAQREISSRGTGTSDLYIAKINPDEPWKLTNEPVRILVPKYGWDRLGTTVDEGPYVLRRDDKIFITFSGSSVSPTYCVGLLTADADADLMDPASWVETGYPILASENVPGQYGPGHNAFTVDANGNDVLIYHAKNGVNGSRDMGARRVHWAADGTPVLDMTADRELKPAYRNVQATITVGDGSSTENELKLKGAAEDLSIIDADNVLGNITLPVTGKFDTAITWTSSDPVVISDTAVPNEGYADTPAGAVVRGETDQVVTMTATLSLNGQTLTKDIDVTVKAKPEEKEYAGYLYAYFNGDEHYPNDVTGRDDAQQIFFAISEDGLNWEDLNYNNPVLTSDLGEKAVRDHYIIRSAEGDKFFLIATDLDVVGHNWDWGHIGSQGSTSLIIWESIDLVNWSKPRMVDIASEINAGHAWAPESIYDEKTGEYLVYWSSSVPEENHSRNNVYVAKTRDFYSFTEPELYITGDCIDASMYKEGDAYYRLLKVGAVGGVRMSKSDSLLDYSSKVGLGDSFTSHPQAELDALNPSVGAYEGPTMFKFNDRDEWCILVDEFGGKTRGYIPLVTNDLTQENSLRLLNDDEYLMPTGAKHGAVIPVTQEEYDALTEKWLLSNKVTEEKIEKPILAYNFDETLTEKTAADASGNDRTAKLFGNTSYVQDAEKGSVLYTDGSNGSYLEFPQGFFDGRNEITISMDIKSQMDDQFFFTFAVGQNTKKYMFLRTRPNEVRNAITTLKNRNEREVITKPTQSIKNKWMNVKLVMKDHVMKMYVDNVLVDTHTKARMMSDMGDDLLAYLGKSFYSADPYFKGYFDNVEVYNYAMFEEPQTEKSELQKALDAANKMAENTGAYTAESIVLYKAEIVKAQAVLDDSKATQEEINGAVIALEEAKSLLVEVLVFDVITEDIENIAATAGTMFSMPVSLTKFPTDDAYKAVEGVLALPEGVNVTSVTPSITGSDIEFSYHLKDGILRFAYIATDKNEVTMGDTKLVTVNMELSKDMGYNESMEIVFDRLIVKSSDKQQTYGLNKANCTITTAEKEVAAVASVLFIGDGSDVIPAGKKAVSVIFTGIEETADVKYGDIQFYYNAQRSENNKQQVYVGMVDEAVTEEMLSDAGAYTIVDSGMQTIMFGDLDDSKVIDAQDALNVVSAWLRIIIPETDKELMAMNVTADSVIDTADAITLVNFYLTESLFPIVKK